MVRQTPVYGWPEMAMGAQLATFGWCTFLFGFTSISFFAIFVSFVIEPAVDAAVERIAILFIALPTMFTIQAALSLPSVVRFHTYLLKCLEREPIAPEGEDAQEVQWYLERFRLAHRLACRFRGRDYAAMLVACERAQVQNPERPLPSKSREGPSLIGILWTFPNNPDVRERVFESWRWKETDTGDDRDAELR